MRPQESGMKRAEKTSQPKRMRRVNFKDEHEVTAVTQPPNTEDRGSETAEDVPDSFLAKREQNIKANKAMVTLHKHFTT